MGGYRASYYYADTQHARRYARVARRVNKIYSSYTEFSPR